VTKISAVLIVKNEETLLGRCLNSIGDADEIVVCDTGSTDNTLNIVKGFALGHNLALTHFEWCDDFAAARNYAKSFATNEWVLSIDADETLEPGGMDTLRAAVKTATGDGIRVRLAAEGSGHEHWVPRFFKRSVDWVGAVHELPQTLGSERVDVTITYGYSPAHEQDPDRVLRILSNLEDPEPRELYYLAREHYYRSDWQTAVATLDAYLARAEWMPERADGWLMMARCLWNLSRGEEARTACLQALANNANFKEALLFMAEMSWPENAERWRSFAELADNRNVLFVRT
jgi:glycosyltransferase involved in cell wall biosynthesis